ncbi:hypothetical protein VTO73DRAFT_12105 [Trametes versicolor]
MKKRACFEDPKDEGENYYQEMFASGKLGKSLDNHFEQETRATPGAISTSVSKRQRVEAEARAELRMHAPKTPPYGPASPPLPVTGLALLLASTSSPRWYPDGNIILRVNDTLFRLHHSRLARYCQYFPQELMQPSESSAHGHQEMVDGCPVFTISTLNVKDLEVFLAYLESPVQLATNPPSQAVASSILRASHVLKSPLFTSVGIRALESLWPSQYSPDTPMIRRPWTDALDAITLAHEHRLPQLLKPAFFTLLRSYTFWDTLKHDRARIPLPEADLLRLYDARRAMERAWRLLVLAPPPPECCAPERAALTGMACKVQGTARAGEWCAFWIERGYVEQGAHDPWRNVAAMKVVCADLRATWCWWCLEERMQAWDAALLEWWDKLDDWLGIKRIP